MNTNKLNSIIITALLFIFSISTKAIDYNYKNKCSLIIIPDSVMLVFNKSCIACHSNEGNFFVKMKLNFSKWDNYSISKQQNKAIKISDELKSNSMPPEGWKKKNEKFLPTKKEIDEVYKWANNLTTKK